jgi:hypothetical protein
VNDIADVQEYHVRSGVGVRAFAGVLLAEVSTETPRRPRWIEMTLYRDWEVKRGSDGQPVRPLEPVSPRGYILHVTGWSLVYHTHLSRCNTGVPVHGSELDADAEPCKLCGAPADPGDDELVDAEEDRHTVFTCADPNEVISRLHDPRTPENESGWLSVPAQRLLQIAAASDSGIASITSAVQWLETRLHTRSAVVVYD